MPSSQAETITVPSQSAAQELASACRALWLATLSLMTAYMQNPAPAHRLLLARRIARNLDTLSGQECFSESCRKKFGKLAQRWQFKGVEGHEQLGFHPSLRNALKSLL